MKQITIAILVPCYNEEKTIEKSLHTWINQTRRADQIIVVDDGSTDGSAKILKKYPKRITYIHQKNSGNKSFVQETGLKYVKCDVVIATDADTLMSPNFVEQVYKAFQDPTVDAFAGYVKSLPNNWVTACREIDYAIGQDIYKTAQDKINYLFVIPGCAGAFKTNVFREHIKFDHDTLTEDLDFTYKLHKKEFKIAYHQDAIVYTQDPNTVKSYLNQMRRWYGGGFQNLRKHIGIVKKPNAALELSLMYLEGAFFACLLLLMPIINLELSLYIVVFYIFFNVLCGLFVGIRRKRWDLLLYSPFMIVFNYINSYVFLEQFVKELIFKKRNLIWYHPDRRNI